MIMNMMIVSVMVCKIAYFIRKHKQNSPHNFYYIIILVPP